MTVHNENFRIRLTDFADSSNLKDAFGRLRTAGTGQRFDNEFIYDKRNDFFDELVNNGTVTHDTNSRDLTLALSDANNGSFAKMASYPVPYTPGNGQLIDMTGVLDYANIGTGSAEIFFRTKISGSVVTTTVAQSEWDNFANSGDISWNFSQIFMISFQSLKTGNINYYITKNGVPLKCTTINNDNVRNTGFWQMPALPVYYHLYTDSGTTYMELGYGDANNGVGFRYKIDANADASMKAICATVKSEGGTNLRDMPGFVRSVDRGITAKTVSTTLVPLISIRARATFNSLPNLGLAIPKQFTIQSTEAIKIVILHDVTLTDESWTPVDADESIMEYDVSATAVTGGHENFTQYLYATSTGPASSQIIASAGGLLGKTVLWNRQHDTVTGIYTLAAIRTGASDASVLAGVVWEEIL
jgi:hypothetical protein